MKWLFIFLVTFSAFAADNKKPDGTRPKAEDQTYYLLGLPKPVAKFVDGKLIPEPNVTPDDIYQSLLKALNEQAKQLKETQEKLVQAENKLKESEKETE
jgi:hypothetical protein